MNRTEAYIKFLVYMAVIILVNIAGMTLFFRIDLTENDIYSLSDASQEAVATLSEPMTIKVFFTGDLPAPHNNTRRYLRDLLEAYGIHANRYFNYRFYDVSPQQAGVGGQARENRKIAENYGIRPVEIQSVEQDEVKFKKAYMGLVVIHGDLIEKIPAITSTDQIEYQLTTAIKKLNNKISRLAGLEEKIRIKLFMSGSLASVAPYMELDQLPRMPEMIRETVSELNESNYNRLDFEYVDPGQSEKLDETVSRYNIMSLKWPDIEEQNIEAGRGAIGLVMAYKDKIKTVRLLDIVRLPIIGTRYELIDPENLNELINENIETLIGINEDIGYLAGHGTPPISRTPRMAGNQPQGQPLRRLNDLLSETYSIREIEISEQGIPESLNCLLIAQPTREFSDYELYQIDQALMRGTNLAVFANAYREMEQPRQQQFNFNQPTHEPIDTGLKKLLAHYGINLRDAFVMDKNCYEQRMPSRSGAGGGVQPIFYAPIIKNRHINKELDFMKNIKGMITLQHSPLELNEKRLAKQGLAAHELFSSSDASWLATGRTSLNPMLIQPPRSEEAFSSHPLAYMLEGEFQSYFADKPMPVKETENPDGEDSSAESGTETREAGPDGDAAVDLSRVESRQDFIASGSPARLVMVGSSDLLTDNLIDEQGQSPNTAFVLNIIDVLNHRADIAALRSKTQRFNPLEETTAAAKTMIKTVNIAGLPVLVVVFGLFVWWRRRLRRKQIQMMFPS